MYKASFVLDGLVNQPIEGWTDGTTWNGWATPRFTYNTSLSIVKTYNARPHKDAGEKAWYSPVSDTFCFANFDFPDEPEEFAGAVLEIDEQPTKLYAIGAWCWVWTETSQLAE
jgi:hypothetical protein